MRQSAYTINAVSLGTISSGNHAPWSHTAVAGTNTGLLVPIGTHQGTITAVNYGAASLTKIAEGASSFNECGDLWLLLSPPPGTATISVTMSGGSWWGGWGVNLANIKQTYTLTSAIAGGAGTLASVNLIPPSSYNLLVAAVGSEATPSAALGSLSLGILQGQSYENGGAEALQVVNTVSQSMAFPLSSSQRWGIAAAAIEPANVTFTSLRQLAGTRQLATGRSLAA